VLFLIVLNGVLAMSELAVVSARTSRLKQRADEGSRGARTAIELADDPNKFLSTVQIGITLIGIVNGAFGGATLSRPFGDVLANIPVLEPFAGQIAGITVVLFITYLSLIIGELVPKQLALQRAETIASLVAPAMKMLAKASAPIVWFLSISSDFVLRVLRAEHSDEPAVTEEEVKILLRQATDAGIFHEAEQDMVSGIFGLGDRNVGELMTPRNAVVFVDVSDPDAENFERIRKHDYEVYPVCEDSTDNVIGILSTDALWRHHLTHETTTIRDAIEPALFVPEISPVLTTLQQMRETKNTMAVVIDEYGGVEGVLTLGDVLEDLVDQVNVPGDGGTYEGAVRREDGSWLVDGAIPAHEIREIFGIDELAGEEHGRFESIGGFILDQLGHFPVPGERVAVEGHIIEVVDMDGHRIDKVMVIPPDPESADVASEDT
jgi:putative hemolysin